MTIKLIAIDMDETFLRTDKTYDVSRFKRVLTALLERDIIVCIASGNSFHKLEVYFDEEDRDRLYFAGDNGNYIVRNQKLLHALAIEPATMLSIENFLDEFDGFHPNVSIGVKTYFRETSGAELEVVKRYNDNIDIVNRFSEIPSAEQAVKIAIHSEKALHENKTMARIIIERYDDVTSVTSGDGWLDVYHRDGGKGASIRYLQDKYNISSDETMAFGDSLNDSSMMHEALYSVSMGNADPDLVADTHYQIGNNNDQAVLDILEQLLANDSMAFMKKFRRDKR
ncbi:HAD family hydrolase [Fundicoccus sp. Sow4_F4]|uniref:HAD family hydrolase n=1 Tax=Fundicoccus sp. Sow4_F4 TaxID=3438783 RepID=UPI003F9261F1